VKSSALIAVAASCGVLAAAGAGVASWAVVTVGQAAAISAAGQIAGEDGIFVGDELSTLLLTDAQISTVGIAGTVDGVSAEYGSAPIEASPECAYMLGQTPLEPAGARSFEISDGTTRTFRQQIVQFPDTEAAATEFAVALAGADQCASFVDDLGTAWSWTTVTSTDTPAVIAGYAGAPGTPDRVVVIGLTSNVISFSYAATSASTLTPEQLSSAVGEAVSSRLMR